MHFDVGEKIKQVRLQRKMTQSELAGDQITRNMLSRVENGAALPSLPTLWYLAERLDVPAGFLLAEGNDDRTWRKMNRIERIRRMLHTGDARICMQLCTSENGEEDADDELYLIMAQCSLRLAAEAFDGGRLHESCAMLDDALAYAQKTVYDTSHIRQRAALYFRFMKELSPLLYSEILTDTDDPMTGATDDFGRYVLACEALEAGEERYVRFYTERRGEDGWSAHFAAHCDVHKKEYAKGGEALLQLLRSDRVHSQVLLYRIFCDLELCCRETEDFKGAYEYAQNRMALLEKMLQK